MVSIFRVQDTAATERRGYSARYYADIKFEEELDTAGFIHVNVPAGTCTEPHAHEKLEELFVALTRVKAIVNGTHFYLESGDLLVVMPNEFHSLEAPESEDAILVAIKFPNLKSDKIRNKH